MRKLLALLLTCFVLSSCEKEEPSPVYPVKMTFDGIEPVSEMQVYTSDGRLLDAGTNAATISDFLDRYYWIGSTWYNSAFVEPNEEAFRKAYFTFFDDGGIDYSAIVEISDIERVDDILLLRTPFTNKVENDSLGASAFFKYPFKTTQDGNRYYIHYVVRSDERSELQVPLLYYKLVRYDENGNLSSVNFGTARNELNPAFIQTLGAGDTLAVKSYILNYSAK